MHEFPNPRYISRLTNSIGIANISFSKTAMLVTRSIFLFFSYKGHEVPNLRRDMQIKNNK